MKRLFSLQHQVILVLMAFMGLSFLLTGYLVRDISQSMILREKQEKLLTIAHILDARLPPEGFDGILLRYHAENATREDKIRILNRVLRQDTDNIGESAPGLGVGFYSRDLDAIVTYGPSISFGSTVGTSVAADHPGRQVMETSTQIVKSGSMVRGDILNAMIPIQRGGKTIGYIWANELTTDISAQLGNMTRNIFLVTLLSSSLIFILLILLARRTLNDIDRIITGTRNIRNDLSQRIEVRKGDLGEIADNINGMAESVGKAVDKANNAIAVLQNVMSNVDAMICVCDPQTKKVVYINDWLCRRLGRNDLEGKTCYEVLHGHTEPCSFCPHKYLFDEDGHPVDEILNRTIHNQLINCNLMVTDKLVKWYDGRVLHMEIGTDATERNAKAISEAVNQAQQSFLARFNHEIRPPMDNILGVTHTALEAFPSPEQAAYLQKIQSSARGLLEVINDIMDYQRIEANEIIIEKQAFNVRKAIESVKKAIMPRAEAKYLEFQVTVDNSIPEYVIGDELRFSQVLLHLLGNAVKFTFEGSVSLNISAERQAMGILRINCVVSDTGIGMSAEQIRDMFVPLYHTDKSLTDNMGSGLGLTICKALIEQMDGKISGTSVAGKGSEFSFFIECEPLLKMADTDNAEATLWQSARYSGAKILLAESSAVDQEATRQMLSELGAEVEITDNGFDVVKLFLQEDYAVILMDMRLPIINGLEATRRIRASTKHDALDVSIVAMTSSDRLEYRLIGKNAGMNAYVVKPVNTDELKRALYEQIHLKEIIRKEKQEHEEQRREKRRISMGRRVTDNLSHEQPEEAHPDYE